ncbi:MAG: sulfite exporter TauE/SafE family protein, partial [Pseudomonas sagittaria]|nr:sulfite exporter TauE/SafE family protein [Pseudomonas sagittaria]
VRIAGGLLVILFGLWTLPGPHQAWLMGHGGHASAQPAH